MSQYMRQAAKDEPQAADLQFLVGESYRALGNYISALAAYDQSIEIDPYFSPAYVGRARVNLEIDPEADIESDLQYAIDLDPNYDNAYLVRAALRIAQEDYEAAFEDLEEVELLAPYSPLLYLYRAQAFLALGKIDEAQENALTAYNLDQTSLPAYLVLGQVSLAAGDITNSIDKLKTYLLYQPEDAFAWSMLGEAYYKQGTDYRSALAVLNKALGLDEENPPALLYRGLTFLELKEGQLAVNDLFKVRNLDREAFEASLGLGRGLFLTDRFPDAISQMTSSQSLAKTDYELAQVYYWRALARKAEGETRQAAKDWQLLLSLEKEFVPEEWITEAEQNLISLTPSPTPSPSAIPRTPTPTIVPTAKPNQTPSAKLLRIIPQ
jgi:tetratricopeptide (TPR) repeat protein